MNPDELVPPHCDPAILHAPGECKFCDELPDWQALRQLWGICYTGHTPEIANNGLVVYEQIACPSDIRRPGGSASRWPRNRAEQDD